MSDKELTNEKESDEKLSDDMESSVTEATTKVEEAVEETKEAAEEVAETVEEKVETSLETAGADAPDSSSDEVKAETVSASAADTSTGGKSQLWQVALVVAGLIAVFALTSSGLFKSGNGDDAPAGAVLADPVATVNGEPISLDSYNQQIQQAETVLAAIGGGAQNEDPAFQAELRQRILDDLVNAELLYQKAVEAGMLATEEQVEAEYQSTLEQVGGPESLETQLATIGLDNDGLRELLARQITIESYINENTTADEVEVPEEEIQEFYDASISGAPEGVPIPNLEEVRPQIEAQLSTEKASEVIQVFVDELRQDASIEVHI